MTTNIIAVIAATVGALATYLVTSKSNKRKIADVYSEMERVNDASFHNTFDLGYIAGKEAGFKNGYKRGMEIRNKITPSE
jgi:hypothetical protein